MTIAPGPEGKTTPQGLRVLVTRPAEQAQHWAKALRAHGLDAEPLPLIGIAPAADPSEVDAAWCSLAAWSLLVFVSPNAAAQWFARRPQCQAWPAGLLVASPGPGTSALLREHGVPPACLIEPASDAEQFDSEALWAELQRHPWAGRRALIVRGDGGRAWLAEQLVQAGAEVAFLAAYRRGAPVLDADQQRCLQQALDAPAAHVWLISSSEALDHLPTVAHIDAKALAYRLQAATAVATHPRIAERAQRAGFGQVHGCRPEVAAVVACIQSLRPSNPIGTPCSAL